MPSAVPIFQGLSHIGLPKITLSTLSKLVHTTRPSMLMPEPTSAIFHVTGSTATRLSTLPRPISMPTSHPTPDANSSGTYWAHDGGKLSALIVLCVIGAFTICCFVICACNCYRHHKENRVQASSRGAATTDGQPDIYTTRREAFSRRRAAMLSTPTNGVDLERGPQQQQNQQQGNEGRLPRYESLFGDRAPGQEYWPLQEVRLASPRRVMTDPMPEGVGQSQGGVWMAPWAVADGAGKHRT